MNMNFMWIMSMLKKVTPANSGMASETSLNRSVSIAISSLPGDSKLQNVINAAADWYSRGIIG